MCEQGEVRIGSSDSRSGKHANVGQLTLTKTEQALVDQVVAGGVLDLMRGALDEQQIAEKAMRSWGPERTIRGVVIRDILRGQLAANPDPHGLRLCGARVDGIIDLQSLTSTVPIILVGCLLSEGVLASSATLSTVIFHGCLLEHPSQPPLVANQLSAARLALTRSTVRSRSEDGAVNLQEAHLGRLEVDGATLTNDAGPALHADFLTADRGVSLTDHFKAIGSDGMGALRLAGGRLGSQLICTDATLTNDIGPALYADGLTVDLGVFFDGGFKATGGGERGAVRLTGAHISGNLDCTGATLTSDTGPALVTDGMTVGHVYLSNGFKATGGGERGAVRLTGAHISGNLDCTAPP
jgi:hypothetical protein